MILSKHCNKTKDFEWYKYVHPVGDYILLETVVDRITTETFRRIIQSHMYVEHQSSVLLLSVLWCFIRSNILPEGTLLPVVYLDVHGGNIWQKKVGELLYYYVSFVLGGPRRLT